MTAAFEQRFGHAPTSWWRAPGRVDLMGTHTDYNEGHVLTMTVDRDTWMAVRARSDRRVRVASMDLPGTAEFSLDAIGRDEAVPWSEYVRGAAWALMEAGHQLAGLDGLVHSRVPFGSGLSSSAAIEIATLLAFEVAGGFRLDPLERARLGQRAENDFVGVRCGILDQYTSVFGAAGRALLLDCRELTSRGVPIAPALAVVICDTRADRHLSATGYAERRAQCEAGAAFFRAVDPAVMTLRDVGQELLGSHGSGLPAEVRQRCRFIIEEEQRVLDLATILPAGDRGALRAAFDASWEGANELFGIGAPSMSAMHAASVGGPGLVAQRQAGGGFGGCLVALVERPDVEAFGVHVEREYASQTGVVPRVFQVEAAAGAGPVEADVAGSG